MRKRFKNLNNRELVNVINERYLNGLNDDDYVAELCYRRDTENFKIIPKWNTYEIEESKELQKW